jgi:protein-disulfide isomerase
MTTIRRIFLAVFSALSLAAALPAPAQQVDLNLQILQELRAIRELLEAQQRNPAQRPAAPQAAPDDRVSLPFDRGGYSLGKTTAPLVMVEYTDYECPFCRQFHLNTFEQIRKNYIDSGKVLYVSRDFPLDFHKNAPRAAAAGRCAAEQQKFWELRHVMIANADKLGAEQIVGYAKELKLDLGKFRPCMQSNRFKQSIDEDMQEGRSIGISGTPSFVIGRVVDGKLEGIRMVGALPYINFAQKLDQMLAQAGAK